MNHGRKPPPIRIGSRFFHKKLERVFRIAGAAKGKEGACCLLDTITFVSYTADFVIIRNVLDIDDQAMYAMFGGRPAGFERISDEPTAFERAGQAMKAITEMRTDGSAPIKLTDGECEEIARQTVFNFETVRKSFKRRSPIVGGDER